MIRKVIRYNIGRSSKLVALPIEWFRKVGNPEYIQIDIYEDHLVIKPLKTGVED